MSWLMGLTLVAALGWGIWLGLPRRYEQPLDDIDRRLSEEGKHQQVRRHMTVLNLLQKKNEKGSTRRQRSNRRPFQTR